VQACKFGPGMREVKGSRKKEGATGSHRSSGLCKRERKRTRVALRVESVGGTRKIAPEERRGEWSRKEKEEKTSREGGKGTWLLEI